MEEVIRIHIADHCSVCGGIVKDGGIYLTETEVFEGLGAFDRIMTWHADCCPKHLKDRYDEITCVQSTD